MPLEDRMGVLSSFEMVDLVTVLAEESSRRLLDALQPDVVVQ
jgi:bifunctional ADP-heptose synthase (sugar kinase/adenylyltransferase)